MAASTRGARRHGIEFLDGPGRGARLRETVAVLDEALRGDPVSHDGVHVHLADAVSGPARPSSPRPPLWVAAQATRSLRVAVRYADAVVTLGEEGKRIEESLPAFRRRMATSTSSVRSDGRDPATLRRCLFAGWANEPIFASVEATANTSAATSRPGRPTSRSTSTTPPSHCSVGSSPSTAWPPASSSSVPPRTSSPTTEPGRASPLAWIQAPSTGQAAGTAARGTHEPATAPS